MAYSDFTLEKAVTNLGIITQEADLFPQLVPLPIPAWLDETLKKRTQLFLISEKARSEFIIAPILLACRDISQDRLAIFSGQRLDVDPAQGLIGECDFILALAPPLPPLRSPIITIVEAKKNDVEAGLGQCIAQMVAADLFNRSSNQVEKPVYGCVTTGEVWQFLKLFQKIAFLDHQRYYLDNVGAILAIVQTIVQQFSGE
ncbi:hypothetical protein LC593_16005 [Nostoc sp. CHAB 5844]|nr:hypothetical protein [Nostoc sp. CHAB 5844]